MSSHEETFFGPYEMPMLNVQLVTESTDEDDDEDEAAEEQEGTKGGDEDGGVARGGGQGKAVQQQRVARNLQRHTAASGVEGWDAKAAHALAV